LRIVAAERKVKPFKTEKTMGVYLREKKMGGGQVSFYLDIYHNKTRWYEFLEIRINKGHPLPQDKEKKRLAQEIRSKREHELIVQENGLLDRGRRKADFVSWYKTYMVERKRNYNNNLKTYKHLERYLDNKPLPFHAISPEWIKGWSKYLLTKVSHNTTIDYNKNLFTALEEAVRKEILFVNPFRKIPRHERLRLKPVYRNAWTLDELQHLMETPCKMEPQYRQAYLFSCFSGLRWSDVNPLRWDEIITKTIDGQDEWFIYFEQEKTEDIEYLPLSDQAVDILKERKGEQAESGEISPYVFERVKETDEVMGKVHKRVWYFLKKWATAAGFNTKRMHFHSGRHTFATNVLENSPEGDLWTVSKLLGHKTISATQIYAHVRDKRKTSAVKALPRLKVSYT
jgi:integrase